MSAETVAPSAEADGSYSATAVVPARGRGIPLEKIPRNVQRIDRASMDSLHPVGIRDVLDARLGSVVVNDVQNNPFQPDLQYRGFTASPLLGTPQGIAVYQNGVRIHDSFGDVVQWDLVPAFAVQEVQLQPGANPVYGLNSLGGGLVLQMKDAWKAQGTRLGALAGSFGRYQTSLEHGIVSGDWGAYAGVSVFGERGFRDESPSTVRHVYADLRERGTDHEVGANVTLADTSLNGNGPVPIELLEQRRSAVFTYPDNTSNELIMVAADAREDLGPHVILQGDLYLRHQERSTSNGDAHEFEECSDDTGAGLVCDEGDELLVTEGQGNVPLSDRLFDGVFNTTVTSALGYGGTVQATVDAPLARRPNQLVAGASYDGARSAFLQRTQLGHITVDRGVSADGPFAANPGFRTKLDVDNHHVGVFAADTFTPVEPLALQLSGRFNWSEIQLIDRSGDALDGTHHFDRVNPAIGLTYTPVSPVTVFAGYGEASRAPSAVELACADPDEPCRVPNAFLADPPLDQVVTRSVELGVRGTVGGTTRRPALGWSLAGFGARNFDDITFVAGSRVGTGYFRNAGTTQRIGLEAAVDGSLGLLRYHASYTLLRATFEDALSLPGLPEDDDDEMPVVDVEKGDRLPGLPTHSLKAGVIVSPVPEWDIGLSANVQSSRPFRGDEGNDRPEVDGYAVFDANMSYWVLPSLQLFIKVQNLLDTEYETFGLLADPSEVLEDASDPRFLGPGSPLGVWAGVVLRNF